MNNATNISDLKEWIEVTAGIYRFVLSEDIYYEIHVTYHRQGEDVLNAKASLYIAGDWCTTNGSVFERECLLSEKTVLDCINKAVEDYKENIEKESEE